MSIKLESLLNIINDFDFRYDEQQKKYFLPPETRENFWKWFDNNAKEYNPNNNLQIKETSFDCPPGNCFANSQIIAIKTKKEYIEGFYRCDKLYELHGFNLNNGQIEDFTLIANKKTMALPNKYVGVKIPLNYILKNRSNEELIQNSNPLLFSYFKSNSI